MASVWLFSLNSIKCFCKLSPLNVTRINTCQENFTKFRRCLTFDAVYVFAGCKAQIDGFVTQWLKSYCKFCIRTGNGCRIVRSIKLQFHMFTGSALYVVSLPRCHIPDDILSTFGDIFFHACLRDAAIFK